tara:strand:+ start:2724 stop:3059 length:336 start_codon:yes stop_codon:yes gene_type:complete
MIGAFAVVASMITVTMITVATSAMSFLGFSYAFSPRFFHPLASFVAFLVTHLVPAISQRVRRAFPMGRTAVVSFGFAMSLMRWTFSIFRDRRGGEEGDDACREACSAESFN